MQTQEYDAIVVGSGISGGWAAKELTEKGLRVLVLERGKNIEHIKDYVNATKAPWEYPHRGGRTRAMEELYPVLKRDYPLNETNLDYWASDKDSPYTEVKRFDWFRGYHVGGRSLMWGRQSYRHSDFDFEANAKEGVAVDWPIRYAEISPWYDYVERHAGINGSIEGMPQLPDGKFLPPMQLNCGEKMVADKANKIFGPHRRIIPGRSANLTQGHDGRSACQYRNACWLGCPYGAYFSSQSSTLPHAAKTGKMTLKPWQIVSEVIYDKDAKRATGVRAMDALNNQMTDYKAKVVFLCASTLNSTWLLMRSATDVWPGGLGSSSGELGHNLMDHHFRAGAQGSLEGLDDKYVFGRRPNGFYIPRYQNLFGDKRGYLRGFGYQGGSRAGSRRQVQGCDGDARWLGDRRHRFRRDAAEPQQQDHSRHYEEGQMGNAGDRHRLRHRGKRAPHAARHAGRHGRAPQCLRSEERYGLRRGLLPWNGNTRDGYGAHGSRSEDLGSQFAQPGLGCAERVRHRRILHGVSCLC
jgi:choline dehydrogenase-like flavoprotein